MYIMEISYRSKWMTSGKKPTVSWISWQIWLGNSGLLRFSWLNPATIPFLDDVGPGDRLGDVIETVMDQTIEKGT